MATASSAASKPTLACSRLRKNTCTSGAGFLAEVGEPATAPARNNGNNPGETTSEFLVKSWSNSTAAGSVSCKPIAKWCFFFASCSAAPGTFGFRSVREAEDDLLDAATHQRAVVDEVKGDGLPLFLARNRSCRCESWCRSLS